MENREWLFRRQKHYLAFWVIIIFIIIFSFFFITCFSYYPYYQVTGIYKKEDKNVFILLESTRIHDNKIIELKIEQEKVDIKEIEISDYLVSDNKIYNQIIIPFAKELDKGFVNISVKLDKTTLWQKLWKGR